MRNLVIKPGEVTLSMLRTIAKHHVPIALDPSAYRRIDLSKRLVDNVIEEGKPVYSINTGFGALAKVRIPPHQFAKLQRNIVLSHATGVGRFLDDDIVRLIMLLKINALAQGYSGVRREIIDFLITLYNNEVYPCIPEKGSVGASGDLAPLSHLALPIIGAGQVRVHGILCDSKPELKKIGLKPMDLEPKEGLALLNGTQVSTALAIRGLLRAEECFAGAVVAGAMTVDAFKGSSTPFDPDIQKVRRQKGQIDVAKVYINLLKDSAIRASHAGDHDERVQDPYSIRCMPQVMGACLDHIRFSADIFLREANAVTDNPLVMLDTGEIKSGGNFHAEPIAMAADSLALAIAEIGNMSERRVAMLIDSKISGLPAFLVKDAGVNSGFMIAHVTAAALASENKCLAHPASVDSIPTSANQEDHVSMATYGARRLNEMGSNTANIVGIELLAAAQGMDFHKPLKTSKSLQAAVKLIRAQVSHYDEDHYFAPDIRIATRLVEGGSFLPFVGAQPVAVVVFLMKRFNLVRGDSPLLISIPHMGTFLPPDLKHRMTPEALRLSDTDWHVDKLYWFAQEMGISMLMATHSRYVIDLNRPQDDQHLYPGQVKTGLCPLETFDGEKLYKEGEEPDDIEKLNRVVAYWQPYHETIEAELTRIKQRHGYAILYDAHSIRTEVPRLFDGKLWDLNLGTAHNKTCGAGMGDAALAAAGSGGYSSILNGRFVGGYITRNYGQPENNVHAIQMELTWGNYMDENQPYLYRPDKAKKLQPVLKNVLQAVLDWGRYAYP